MPPKKAAVKGKAAVMSYICHLELVLDRILLVAAAKWIICALELHIDLFLKNQAIFIFEIYIGCVLFVFSL